MGRRSYVGLALAVQLLGSDAHFAAPPCASDEVQGEIQDASGFVCSPRCEAGTYSCPGDVPSGATAQPQCMFKDVDQQFFCGLLCQVDAQCPSGARCKALSTVEVGICLYPVSFADWARKEQTRKLAIGWPSAGAQSSGSSATSFQIAKTYQSLQSLKSKYAIDDGDADMLTLKEFLSSLSTSGAGGAGSGGSAAIAPAPSILNMSPGALSHGKSNLAPWEHDVEYFEKNMANGLPGLQREFHDTLWNIEHIEKRGVASELLRGTFLLAIAYLGIGSAIKYQAMGSRGTDMIPHVAFWAEYPGMVMDGIMYSKILAGIEQGYSAGPSGGGLASAPASSSSSSRGGGLGGFESMA